MPLLDTIFYNFYMCTLDMTRSPWIQTIKKEISLLPRLQFICFFGCKTAIYFCNSYFLLMSALCSREAPPFILQQFILLKFFIPDSLHPYDKHETTYQEDLSQLVRGQYRPHGASLKAENCLIGVQISILDKHEIDLEAQTLCGGSL